MTVLLPHTGFAVVAKSPSRGCSALRMAVPVKRKDGTGQTGQTGRPVRTD